MSMVGSFVDDMTIDVEGNLHWKAGVEVINIVDDAICLHITNDTDWQLRDFLRQFHTQNSNLILYSDSILFHRVLSKNSILDCVLQLY